MKYSNKILLGLSGTDRLSKPSKELLEVLGIDMPNSRKYIQKTKILDAENRIMQGKRDFVMNGVLDERCELGIIGKDKLLEYGNNLINILSPLGFGQCQLRLGIPEKEGEIDFYNNSINIFTTYENILKKYIKDKNRKVTINKGLQSPPKGSIEGYPSLYEDNDMINIIADITETGNTMKTNEIIPGEVIIESEAVIFKKTNSILSTQAQELLNIIKNNLKSTSYCK